MICPKCGKEMQLGEMSSGRGDLWLYWAPKAFFEKHWINTYSHRKKTIEQEDGIIIRTNNKLQKVNVAYGCKDCKMIVVDGN